MFRYETIERPTHQTSSYNDTYSNLISPEKVNTLERIKKENKNLLLSEINSLDSAVYGGTNSYNQNSSFNNSYDKSYDHSYDKKSSAYDSYNQTSDYKTDSYSSFSENAPKFSQPYKPLSAISPKNDIKSESNVKTSSYISPDGGYKTDSYKYESYQTVAKPVSTFTTNQDKYYTSTPQSKLYNPMDVYKNGNSGHQMMSYSNVEYINEPPLIAESDSLEQRMCKQSLTQKVIEKKTVHMTSSSKQESSSNTYRFE